MIAFLLVMRHMTSNDVILSAILDLTIFFKGQEITEIKVVLLKYGDVNENNCLIIQDL